MKPVYRRPPRLVLRKFLVWLAWVVLSGYVFHGKTERELRQMSVLECCARVAALVIVLAALYWAVVFIPPGFKGYLGVSISIGASVAVVPLLVQTTVTKYLEFRQVWP